MSEIGRTLTAADPEPPPGTLVRDDCGQEWFNDGYRPCCWVQPDAEVHDPESWTKIAGNYGPVTVLERGGWRVNGTDRMVAWLREAMDAAQRIAEAAGGDAWRRQDHPSDTVAIYDSKGEPVVYDEGEPTEEQQAHIVRHHPAAVLRRIAADRKILAAHPYTTRVITGYGEHTAGFGCETCHDWDGVPEGRGNCATILALAEGWGWTEETKTGE